ncbi:UNVERIFIED_CONTAM: hypothetical protein FKN15_017415 [Acipenser sinensis]
MIVSSKYKQVYECKLPAQAMRFHHPDSAEDSQGYTGLGIPELLKPMEGAPCLIKTKDWWTYEFCYGQHIRQYHMEDSEIKGEILFLGFYSSEFDWNNETAKASKQHRLKRYHSQTYVNGSTCDLSRALRETEVRFMCEEGSSDYITRVDEPQSCSYVLTVHTPRTCQHPFLRPASTNKPHPIKCQPALSPEQYVEYVKAQVSDTKRRVEQISEELKSLDEILSRDDEASSKPENLLVVESVQIIEEDEVDHEADTKRRVEQISEELKSLDEILSRDDEASSKPENLLVVESVQIIEEVDHEGDSAQIEDASNEDADFWDGVMKPDGGESGERNEQMEADGDGEFGEQAIEDTKLDFKTIRNPSDLVKLANLLKEAPEKPKAEGDEQDSKDVSPAKTGENTASVERLERGEDHEDDDLMEEFEKEMKDISVPSSKIGEIRETMEQEFDNIIDEAQQELDGKGLKGEFDRNQAAKTLETTLNQMMDKLEGKVVQDQQEEQTDRARGSPSLAPRQPAAQQIQVSDLCAVTLLLCLLELDEPTDDDDDVKVRITKYKSDGSPQNKMQVQEMSAEDPQVQYIKDVVKEQLEKAGLKAEGKIEVKIMTRGQPDDDDVGWLSREDTKSFREILITLLVGNQIFKISSAEECCSKVVFSCIERILYRPGNTIVIVNLKQKCHLFIFID